MDLDLLAGNSVNRKYKDSVFTLLFDDEDAIRDVSGALFDEKIDQSTEIKKTTLKNVLSNGEWINDLSFLVGGKLVVLVEHQSTLNENMPRRMLHYISEIYNQLCEKEDVYKAKKSSIPKPIFIVLYNGDDENVPDCREYRLSELYFDFDGSKESPFLELVVNVYNINKGHNVERVRLSRLLSDYVAFVAEIRENNKTMSLRQAMEKAVEDCINKNILAAFLKKYRKEIVNMLVKEWNQELAMKVRSEESWQEGIQRGRQEQLLETVNSMYRKSYGIGVIADVLCISEKEVKDILGL
jgi:predicted transposase/invertase (TIGR01784 family)